MAPNKPIAPIWTPDVDLTDLSVSRGLRSNLGYRLLPRTNASIHDIPVGRRPYVIRSDPELDIRVLASSIMDQNPQVASMVSSKGSISEQVIRFFDPFDIVHLGFETLSGVIQRLAYLNDLRMESRLHMPDTELSSQSGQWEELVPKPRANPRKSFTDDDRELRKQEAEAAAVEHNPASVELSVHRKPDRPAPLQEILEPLTAQLIADRNSSSMALQAQEEEHDWGTAIGSEDRPQNRKQGSTASNHIEPGTESTLDLRTMEIEMNGQKESEKATPIDTTTVPGSEVESLEKTSSVESIATVPITVPCPVVVGEVSCGVSGALPTTVSSTASPVASAIFPSVVPLVVVDKENGQKLAGTGDHPDEGAIMALTKSPAMITGNVDSMLTAKQQIGEGARSTAVNHKGLNAPCSDVRSTSQSPHHHNESPIKPFLTASQSPEVDTALLSKLVTLHENAAVSLEEVEAPVSNVLQSSTVHTATLVRERRADQHPKEPLSLPNVVLVDSENNRPDRFQGSSALYKKKPRTWADLVSHHSSVGQLSTVQSSPEPSTTKGLAHKQFVPSQTPLKQTSHKPSTPEGLTSRQPTPPQSGLKQSASQQLTSRVPEPQTSTCSSNTWQVVPIKHYSRFNNMNDKGKAKVTVPTIADEPRVVMEETATQSKRLEIGKDGEKVQLSIKLEVTMSIAGSSKLDNGQESIDTSGPVSTTESPSKPTMTKGQRKAFRKKQKKEKAKAEAAAENTMMAQAVQENAQAECLDEEKKPEESQAKNEKAAIADKGKGRAEDTGAGLKEAESDRRRAEILAGLAPYLKNQKPDVDGETRDPWKSPIDTAEVRKMWNTDPSSQGPNDPGFKSTGIRALDRVLEKRRDLPPFRYPTRPPAAVPREVMAKRFPQFAGVFIPGWTHPAGYYKPGYVPGQSSKPHGGTPDNPSGPELLLMHSEKWLNHRRELQAYEDEHGKQVNPPIEERFPEFNFARARQTVKECKEQSAKYQGTQPVIRLSDFQKKQLREIEERKALREAAKNESGGHNDGHEHGGSDEHGREVKDDHGKSDEHGQGDKDKDGRADDGPVEDSSGDETVEASTPTSG